MKFLKYIVLLLLILIIGFSIYIAVQPNNYEFFRSRTINAPASIVYDKVSDLKQWPEFVPGLEEAKLNYLDKTVGSGASGNWNSEALGEGSITTLEVDTDGSIRQELKLKKPVEANADVNWVFEPSDKGTIVYCYMAGRQNFMSKLYTTFTGSVESEMAPKIESSLVKLDSVVQAQMKVYSVNVEGVTEHSGGYYIYNTVSSKISDSEKNMNQMLSKVGAYALTNNVTMAGPPFVLYHKWDKENDAVIFSCCIPTNTKITSNEPDILTGKLESFRAVKTVLKGNYDNLQEAWDATIKYIADNGLEEAEGGPMLETYITDPKSKPNPADWVTEIYIAVK